MPNNGTRRGLTIALCIIMVKLFVFLLAAGIGQGAFAISDVDSQTQFSPRSDLFTLLANNGNVGEQFLRCERNEGATRINLCENVKPTLANIQSSQFKNMRNGRDRNKAFTEWLAPAARYWGMMTGIPPSLIVAQAIEESGGGSSPRFRTQNNLFSIYCGKVGDKLDTPLGKVPVKPVTCRGRGEPGHNARMTTPDNYQHALIYFLSYLTSKMKRLYPILDAEIKAAKAKGPFEVASIDKLLQSRGDERAVKCGGQWVTRPKFALTSYACTPRYRTNLVSHVNTYSKSLDTLPCKDCLNQAAKTVGVRVAGQPQPLATQENN